MVAKNRIAEAVLYDYTTGGTDETMLNEIERDLNSVLSMTEYGATEARKSEGWGQANLFDLLASHVRNAQVKVSSCLEFQNEQRAEKARETQTPGAVK